MSIAKVPSVALPSFKKFKMHLSHYTSAYDGSSDPTEHVFEANFLFSARPKPTVASLLGMRQKEEEHLGQYLARFTDEVRAILDAHPSLVIQVLMIEIRPSRLF
ncbi:hypothetical protein GW17_00040526 [Ensete ventricosum]|nr:hypothetical protein GW17_00040526 [Ensete ventricosum]RZR80955.1 hypothetical protein BHM03_00007083 [Ensete ventricosum]